jgi:hypothetical protein
MDEKRPRARRAWNHGETEHAAHGGNLAPRPLARRHYSTQRSPAAASAWADPEARDKTPADRRWQAAVRPRRTADGRRER